MSPHITFFFGLLLLILFGCYFAAEAGASASWAASSRC